MVSVVLPVYNGANTLGMAIASIRQQTFVGWELLVLDDGSTDDSLDTARAHAADDSRVRVIADGQHAGLTYRLNQGVGLARGALLARMDADDIAFPERLAVQVDFLQSHQNVDLVGSSMIVFGSGGAVRGKRVAPTDHKVIVRRAWAGFRVFHPTWMARSAWFRAHPYPRACCAEDQVLLFRAHRDSTYANLPFVLLGYREPQMPLRNALKARATMSRMVTPDLWNHGLRVQACLAGLSHGLRAVIDIVSVGLRADHRLLRQRVVGASQPEIQRWQEVWQAVSPMGEPEERW